MFINFMFMMRVIRQIRVGAGMPGLAWAYDKVDKADKAGGRHAGLGLGL